MNMYQKMSNYTNNEYGDYSYQTKTKDLWSSYDQHQLSYTNYVSHSTNYLPNQNEVKRFKLNHFSPNSQSTTSFMDDYDYWNNQQQIHQQQQQQQQHQQQTRSNLHCETRLTSTPTKQLSSPASTSTTRSTSSSASADQSDHLSLCESLHKAYQAGHLTKTRYRRLIANERERNRMHGLNIAFENLRSVLPSLGSSKQFSKYETLQMATNYINALREIILNDDLNTKKF